MGAGAEAQSCFRNTVQHSDNGGRRPAGRHCSCELPGARRPFAMAHPIHGTLAETYLRNRGIMALHNIGALRFHPRCYYCADYGSAGETWPAMIACVTDLCGPLYRRLPHLARSRRLRSHPSWQGANRHPAVGYGRPARQHGPLWYRR
jgi:hypothetical protein